MATQEKTWNVANRLHSQKDSDNPEVNHIIAGADEIYDDAKELKQSEHNAQTDDRLNEVETDLNAPTGGIKDRVHTLEEQVAFEGDVEVENTPQNIISGSGKVTSANAVRGAIDVRTGYFFCESGASTAEKKITAPGFVLTPGGGIKIKMTNANTADNATLNINSTDAKPLYYNGERASASNSWEARETIEVYYDGTNFMANNVAGGGGSGDGAFDVSAKYPTSGVEGGNTYTLDGALAVLNANLPASKKKGGMSIKFIQSSDNKYVQYRLMSDSFNTTEANWQGVDNEPTVGSENLVESGGVAEITDKLGVSQNLFNDSTLDSIYSDKRLQVGTNNYLISNFDALRIHTCKPIFLKAGTYCLSGNGVTYSTPRAVYSPTGTINSNGLIVGGTQITFISVTNGFKFTFNNDGYLFFDNYTNISGTEYSGKRQLEKGDSVSEYKPYKLLSNPVFFESETGLTSNTTAKAIDEVNQKTNGKIDTDYLLHEVVSKNILNPALWMLNLAHKPSNIGIRSNSDYPARIGSGLIEVEPGEYYVVSGDGIFNNSGSAGPQGGFYADGAVAQDGQQAVSNITFVKPVDNIGWMFQVPQSGVKYVVINLNYKTGKLVANAQLEKGEIATEYEPYYEKEVIKAKFLPDIPTPTPTETSLLDEYTQLGNLRYYGIADKLPNFRRHWYAKDKDLVVVNTGTSLTARQYNTPCDDASSRPPLMDKMNFASYIWDAIKWEGQQYRRYDYGTFFTEVGSFTTAGGNSDWDDNTYRNALTRYASGNCSVAFKIPEEAWQFNFIYRTDIQGTENAVINIAGGNGLVQVFNGTDWVEANGFAFSMKESAVVQITTNIIKPEGVPEGQEIRTLTNYQVKGNTVYQKRLKMRCKGGNINSIGTEKSVTISSTSGRFMYWGVEWSNRQYMITYINAARGSWNSSQTNTANARELSRVQDSDIHVHKPDLYLSEDPIHNAGVSDVRNYNEKRSYQFGYITTNFFFADNHVSLLSRGRDYWNDQEYTPEFALFNTTITGPSFGGLDSAGNLLIKEMADGKCWSAYDGQSSCYLKVKAEYPNAIYINACKGWIEACYRCFGTIGAATEESDIDGNTLINSGHWNDNGCKVMARLVLPIIYDV